MSFMMRVPESGILLEAPTNGYTFIWDAATKLWTFGPGGGGGAVDSVFGRIGVVVAATGDYDSDQIDNLSNVSGLSVSDALDSLDGTLTNLVASDIGNDSQAPGITVADALTNVRDIPSIDVATTGNVALTGTPANIDAGVALVSGVTSIFVWLQTNPVENGPYLYNSGGAWTRLAGWTTSAGFRPAQPFQIAGGTLYGGRTAYLKNASNPTVGVTSIIFNMELQITQPTQLGQTLIYNPVTNLLIPTGPKTAQLADANATIGVGTASQFLLQVQLTAARTVTLDNTGATTFEIISFDLQVVLAFNLIINNALGLLYTFVAGQKWIGAFQFSGGQWGGPTGLQRGS